MSQHQPSEDSSALLASELRRYGVFGSSIFCVPYATPASLSCFRISASSNRTRSLLTGQYRMKALSTTARARNHPRKGETRPRVLFFKMPFGAPRCVPLIAFSVCAERKIGPGIGYGKGRGGDRVLGWTIVWVPQTTIETAHVSLIPYERIARQDTSIEPGGRRCVGAEYTI